MRNFFIALFLLFEFLFCGVNFHAVRASQVSYSNKEITQNIYNNTQKSVHTYKNFEHAILRFNNDSEIYTSVIRKISNGNSNSNLKNINYINFSDITGRYSNSTIIFHNIKYIFENEICTRAP